MKLFQWTKIPAKKVRETVWGSLPDDDIKFDYKEIENLFAAKVIEKKEGNEKEESGKDAQSGAKKPGSVTVIDAKRAQNIGNYLLYAADIVSHCLGTV
jgi:hypothetical protein